MDLKSYVRNVPDFPVPGVSFFDITTLLGDARAFQYAIDGMTDLCEPLNADVIVSIESRGFFMGAPLAYRMDKPLVPVRKAGKLPYHTYSASYDLEYGTDALEIHQDAIGEGQRALIVDDVLATGGTVSATAELVRECGGDVVGYAFLIEIAELNGRRRLPDENVMSLMIFD